MGHNRSEGAPLQQGRGRPGPPDLQRPREAPLRTRMSALALARDRARETRLRVRHRELVADVEAVETELAELGAEVPRRETDVDVLIDQWADARRHAERLEQRNAELVRRVAELEQTEARADSGEVERLRSQLEAVLFASGSGPNYHQWLRDRARMQGEHFARLHAAGLSGVQIGERYGMSSTVVYQKLRASGYHARPVRGAKAVERRAEARRLVADGATLTAVGEHFGVSRKAVGKWLAHPERPQPAATPKPPRPCRRDGCPLAPAA